MARRGNRGVALQAALSAISGGLSGYARQQELQKEQDRLKKQEERQGLLDTLSLFEKGALEVGPLATRVPPGASLGEGPRPPMAASGEAVRAPRPSMGAIPLAGVGQEAMQQAEAGLSRYETGGPGALSFEIGGRRMALPSAATRQAEAAQDALSAAIKQAEATGTVRMRQERESEAEGNRSAFEELRALGEERGEFQPNRRYADRLANYYKTMEIRAQRAMTPYQQEQLSLERRRLDIAEGRTKELPVAARNSLSRLDASVLMTQNIDALIQQNPDALGGAKNFLPAQATNRIDPAGVEVRAAVEALSGEIRNLRFGGQLTGGELSQAMTMLPDRQDEPAAALAKLRQLSQFLEQKRQGVYSAFGSVYTPLRSTGSTTGTTGGTTTGGRTTTTRSGPPNNPDEF